MSAMLLTGRWDLQRVLGTELVHRQCRRPRRRRGSRCRVCLPPWHDLNRVSKEPHSSDGSKQRYTCAPNEAPYRRLDLQKPTNKRVKEPQESKRHEASKQQQTGSTRVLYHHPPTVWQVVTTTTNAAQLPVRLVPTSPRLTLVQTHLPVRAKETAQVTHPLRKTARGFTIALPQKPCKPL